MTTGQKWTDNELKEICTIYAAIRELEEHGIKVNKAAIRRGTLPKLEGRSGGSYEMKMQNISAALLDVHYPIIKGYKPLKGYQRSLKKFAVQADHVISGCPGYAGHIIEEATKAGALKK